MSTKILAWITYKGKRIPIRERLFRGLRFASKRDTETLLGKLTRVSPRYFDGLVPHRGRVDWKWIGVASKDVDKRFPGLLKDVEVHFFADKRKRDLKGLVISTAVGKRKIAYYQQVISELNKAGSHPEKFATVARKYHLIPYGVKEVNKDFASFIRNMVARDLNNSIRAYHQNKRLLGDRAILFMNPNIAAGSDFSFVKTEKDAWIHEFGHLLNGKISDSEFKAWNVIYERQRERVASRYGRANPSEGFAEEFLSYVKTGKCSTNVITYYFETLERSWRPF